MSRVGGVGYNLPCLPQGPGGIQVLEGWQIAANHLLSRANDTLQSALVLGGGSSVPAVYQMLMEEVRTDSMMVV